MTKVQINAIILEEIKQELNKLELDDASESEMSIQEWDSDCKDCQTKNRFDNTVKAFVVTPHEMCEILVINVFETILLPNS